MSCSCVKILLCSDAYSSSREETRVSHQGSRVSHWYSRVSHWGSWVILDFQTGLGFPRGFFVSLSDCKLIKCPSAGGLTTVVRTVHTVCCTLWRIVHILSAPSPVVYLWGRVVSALTIIEAAGGVIRLPKL